MITPVSQHRQSSPNFGAYDPTKFYNRITDPLTDKIAHTVAGLHRKTNPGAFVDRINSNPWLKKHSHQIMLNMASFAYTATLVTNTAKSKNIEKDRKPMLMLNAILVTAISSTLSFLIDKKTEGFVKDLKEKYIKHHKITDETALYNLDGSMKKMKSVVLFTTIVRLGIPLLMVPITGSIVKRRKAKQDAQKAAAELEKFRRANPELMGDYEKLKILSAQIERVQIPEDDTRDAKKTAVAKQKAA